MALEVLQMSDELERRVAELERELVARREREAICDKLSNEMIERRLCTHSWKAEDGWRRFESCPKCGAFRRNF
jgi:hypothetical protein